MTRVLLLLLVVTFWSAPVVCDFYTFSGTSGFGGPSDRCVSTGNSVTCNSIFCQGSVYHNSSSNQLFAYSNNNCQVAQADITGASGYSLVQTAPPSALYLQRCDSLFYRLLQPMTGQTAYSTTSRLVGMQEGISAFEQSSRVQYTLYPPTGSTCCSFSGTTTSTIDYNTCFNQAGVKFMRVPDITTAPPATISPSCSAGCTGSVCGSTVNGSALNTPANTDTCVSYSGARSFTTVTGGSATFAVAPSLANDYVVSIGTILDSSTGIGCDGWVDATNGAKACPTNGLQCVNTINGYSVPAGRKAAVKIWCRNGAATCGFQASSSVNVCWDSLALTTTTTTTAPSSGSTVWSGTYQVNAGCNTASCCCLTGAFTLVQTGTQVSAVNVPVTGQCGAVTSTTLSATLSSPTATTFSTTLGGQSVTVTKNGNSVTLTNNAASQCSGTATCTTGDCRSAPAAFLVPGLVLLFLACLLL